MNPLHLGRTNVLFSNPVTHLSQRTIDLAAPSSVKDHGGDRPQAALPVYPRGTSSSRQPVRLPSSPRDRGRYLSGRHQGVALADGKVSDTTGCTCGVPRGSVLGPVPFSLYTRNVAQCASPALVLMFADDIILYTSSSDVATINRVLSIAVSGVATFLADKGLILNAQKTQVLGISAGRRNRIELAVACGGTPLAQTSPAKYLCIYLDERLSWVGHVPVVVKKVSYKLRVLRHIRADISHITRAPLLHSSYPT